MSVRFRILVGVILFLSVVATLSTVYQNVMPVSAQEPRRWVSGDTLWFEIDSLPLLPSDGQVADSAFLLLLPLHDRIDFKTGQMPHSEPLPRVEFDYSIPYWSVYRRSITVWGITFSTGQASPYSAYPAANSLDANVLSFPLQRPR